MLPFYNSFARDSRGKCEKLRILHRGLVDEKMEGEVETNKAVGEQL